MTIGSTRYLTGRFATTSSRPSGRGRGPRWRTCSRPERRLAQCSPGRACATARCPPLQAEAWPGSGSRSAGPSPHLPVISACAGSIAERARTAVITAARTGLIPGRAGCRRNGRPRCRRRGCSIRRSANLLDSSPRRSHRPRGMASIARVQPVRAAARHRSYRTEGCAGGRHRRSSAHLCRYCR